jgi:hypothetical protein
MRNVSAKMCRENQNTRLMFNNSFFRRKSCRLWDNLETNGTARQARYNNIIRRMRSACWITVATDAHSEYKTLLHFRGNNGYTKALQCYVYTYTVLLNPNSLPPGAQALFRHQEIPFFPERLGQTSAIKPQDTGPESLQENMVIEM